MFDGKQQRAEGEGNVIAGRDIQVFVISKNGEKEPLINVLTAIDARINELFPNKIQKQTANDLREAFSGQKLLSSLSIVGIPLDVALEVLFSVENYLVGIRKNSSEISGTDLRTAVFESLYGLGGQAINGKHYTQQDAWHWGDCYVRRFGNPNIPFTADYEDGSTQIIDYEYIKKDLIPTIISDILDVNIESAFACLQGGDVGDMASELMHAFKGLNLYRIHYETLVKLGKELSQQPPHPWIVSRPFDENIVGYDVERARSHREILLKGVDSDDFNRVRYAIKECLHHSCSAVLAYYGVFMGCTELSPFYNLERAIKKVNNKSDDIILNSTKIRRIKHDLKICGYDVFQFLKLIESVIKRNPASYLNDRILPDLINDVISLSDIACQLVETNNYLENNLRLLKSGEDLSENDFSETIYSAFNQIDGFEPKTSKDAIKGITFFHNVGTPLFRCFLPKVLVLGSPGSKKVTLKNIRRIESWFKHENRYSNLAIFVSSGGYSKSCEDFVKRYKNQGIHIALWDFDDLHQLAKKAIEGQNFETMFQNLL